jgi:hypothetical protein
MDEAHGASPLLYLQPPSAAREEVGTVKAEVLAL